MKKIFFTAFILVLVAVVSIGIFSSNAKEQSELEKLKQKMSKKHTSSVDHKLFSVLQRDFKRPQEVTETCLSCHNGRGKEVMKSNHWNWEKPEYIEGKGVVYFGKKNAMNNYCIGSDGNQKSCAKCHIGFGMGDNFDASDEKNIDCLVCHDNSETYAKGNEMGGAPDVNVNLSEVARNVGLPKRTNCGVCHFFGGGGNNVKHGDLEKAMFEPDKETDIHMAIEGMNMECISCHKSEKHNISGKMYSLSSMNRNRSTCEQCHGDKPHDDRTINNHLYKVACQTCHIPVYAKVNSTKTEWDWSTAGQLRDGEPFEVDDSLGNHTYLSIKGSFKWGRNLKPDYIWFNGTASHYILGSRIEDTNSVYELNKLNGSYADNESKIIPLKIHNAKQPFDPVNKLLVYPKLYSDTVGVGAFWKDFDFVKSAEVGMKEMNLPFSGQLSFIRTSMNWPINHMVSSKDKTVQCIECHTNDNSRLEKLTDFYMPARDNSAIVETAGLSLIILTLAGVVTHGILRLFSKKKKENE